MTLNWSDGPLAEGLSCYRRGEFFLAHEHWESVWLQAKEPERRFLQGLILIAAALHHVQRKNVAGGTSLLRKALDRLGACPSQTGGISIAPLAASVLESLEGIRNGSLSVGALTPPICPAGLEPELRAGGGNAEPRKDDAPEPQRPA